MHNRWFSEKGVPKRVALEWQYKYGEYAVKHKEKFEAHRLYFFLKDFKTIWPKETTEQIKCRVVAFIGLFDNERKCDPTIFNEARYREGCMLMIGFVEEKKGTSWAKPRRISGELS